MGCYFHPFYSSNQGTHTFELCNIKVAAAENWLFLALFQDRARGTAKSLILCYWMWKPYGAYLDFIWKKRNLAAKVLLTKFVYIAGYSEYLKFIFITKSWIKRTSAIVFLNSNLYGLLQSIMWLRTGGRDNEKLLECRNREGRFSKSVLVSSNWFALVR